MLKFWRTIQTWVQRTSGVFRSSSTSSTRTRVGPCPVPSLASWCALLVFRFTTISLILILINMLISSTRNVPNGPGGGGLGGLDGRGQEWPDWAARARQAHGTAGGAPWYPELRFLKSLESFSPHPDSTEEQTESREGLRRRLQSLWSGRKVSIKDNIR